MGSKDGLRGKGGVRGVWGWGAWGVVSCVGRFEMCTGASPNMARLVQKFNECSTSEEPAQQGILCSRAAELCFKIRLSERSSQIGLFQVPKITCCWRDIFFCWIQVLFQKCFLFVKIEAATSSGHHRNRVVLTAATCGLLTKMGGSLRASQWTWFVLSCLSLFSLRPVLSVSCFVSGLCSLVWCNLCPDCPVSRSYH